MISFAEPFSLSSLTPRERAEGAGNANSVHQDPLVVCYQLPATLGLIKRNQQAAGTHHYANGGSFGAQGDGEALDGPGCLAEGEALLGHQLTSHLDKLPSTDSPSMN